MKTITRQKSIGFLVLNLALISFSGCAGLLGGSDSNAYEEALAASRQREELRLSQAMTQREITVGMNKAQVMSLWGHPSSVETAGRVQDENERWIFEQSIFRSLGSTRSQPRARVIYFEAGQVVGWETL